MNIKDMPIAVFDSGVGGISVLNELVRQMPNEHFYYRGDSANAPYGTRPAEEIRDLTLNNIQHMAHQGIKGIVIACNTATSAAVTPLRKIYPEIPVVGIEPAVKPAVEHCPNGKVLVLATPMTVGAPKLARLIDRFRGNAEVIAVGCPGLMEFVEQGILDGDELEMYLRNLLSPYMTKPVGAVVLGCTHYPFVQKTVQKIMGNDVFVVDGSEGTAREMKRRLKVANLLSDRTEPGEVKFEVTLPEKEGLCRLLFDPQIRQNV